MDEDEDSLFIRRFVPRLERFPLGAKAYVRFEVEKLFYRTELFSTGEGEFSQ